MPSECHDFWKWILRLLLFYDCYKIVIKNKKSNLQTENSN